ncbi:transmembrane protein 198-like [Clytia hemisphaerica]|uniref:Transmembrane protein 198 n=1 Tax=Clytia hemisphaerica TaxID=252671 RepID=A0A7M5UZL7_9CNID
MASERSLADGYCEHFRYDFDDSIALSVIFGICFIFGVFFIFAGYRFFRTSLFFQTFSLVSLLTYLLVSSLLDRSTVLNAIISVASGLLLGILSMFVTTMGLLMTSLIQAIFLTTSILYAVHIFETVSNVFVAPCICLVLFILLSVPLLKWQRGCAVIYICSYGAILMMLAVDFFIDLSMLRLMGYQNILVVKRTVQPCWFSWCVLALWPLMLFVGCIVQFLKTARDCDHRHKPQWYKRRSNSEPGVRLLSSKSDVIAQAWIHPPVSPSTSDKYNYQHSVNNEDEVFLMEDTTSV